MASIDVHVDSSNAGGSAKLVVSMLSLASMDLVSAVSLGLLLGYLVSDVPDNDWMWPVTITAACLWASYIISATYTRIHALVYAMPGFQLLTPALSRFPDWPLFMRTVLAHRTRVLFVLAQMMVTIVTLTMVSTGSSRVAVAVCLALAPLHVASSGWLVLKHATAAEDDIQNVTVGCIRKPSPAAPLTGNARSCGADNVDPTVPVTSEGRDAAYAVPAPLLPAQRR
jgi:hypothetical protein